MVSRLTPFITFIALSQEVVIVFNLTMQKSTNEKSNDHPYSCSPELVSVDIFASGVILYIHTLKHTKLHDIYGHCLLEAISTIWNKLIDHHFKS